MHKININEQKILEAAKDVFLQKGYYGTRMQDIADKASINKAMLHYYFRSKDKLFDKILDEALESLFSNIHSILLSSKSFEDKINDFIVNYIDTLNNNRFLPAFIIHELNHNRDRIKKLMFKKIKKIPPIFINQIKKEIATGRIYPINPTQLIINLLSLCIFPFIAKNLFEIVFEFNDKTFDKFIEERKKILPQLIFQGIQHK
jgi:AcrR family transcriptional regulator